MSLQSLPQAGVVVCLRASLSARKETRLVLHVGGHGEIALADIHPHDTLLAVWGRVGNRDLQTHQEIARFMRFVIPELRRAKTGAVLDEGHMLGVARVGQNDASLQG